MRKATTQAAATTAADTPKKTRATRQNAPKKAHTPPVDVHLQVGGQDYDCAAIVEMARADYRATHKTGIHSCRVYIKPEEQVAYYVINKVEGKVDISPVEMQ